MTAGPVVTGRQHGVPVRGDHRERDIGEAIDLFADLHPGGIRDDLFDNARTLVPADHRIVADREITRREVVAGVTPARGDDTHGDFVLSWPVQVDLVGLVLAGSGQKRSSVHFHEYAFRTGHYD